MGMHHTGRRRQTVERTFGDERWDGRCGGLTLKAVPLAGAKAEAGVKEAGVTKASKCLLQPLRHRRGEQSCF